MIKPTRKDCPKCGGPGWWGWGGPAWLKEENTLAFQCRRCGYFLQLPAADSEKEKE